MLYVNKQTWASNLFKNSEYHVEKTLSPGQQKAKELSGSLNSETDETLNEISAKLQQGMDLSPSELEYLRQHAPDLYKEAIRMIELKKKIEQRLEQCKTKEEFSRAKSDITSQIATECDVAPSKKCDLEKAKMYERRINLASKCFVRFAKTENYKNLPDTDAEYAKLKSEKLEKTFFDKLEISELGKKKSEETEKTQKPSYKEFENNKKIDEADNKNKHKKIFDTDVSLYLNDYKVIFKKPVTKGFEAKV